MKISPLLSLMLTVTCGCSPGAGNAPPETSRYVRPSAGAIGTAKPAPPDVDAASYEVTIASAQADRVRARDQCEVQPAAQRKSCREAADKAFDQAKSAADATDNKIP